MNRRKFLVNLSALLGCSVASIDVLAINSALTFKDGIKAKLSKQQQQIISTIADIIIPETQTPAASQVGTTLYIDYYLHEFLSADKRDEFLDGLEGLYQSTSIFLSLPEQQQVGIVQQLDNQLHTPAENTTYKKLKELVVVGYYTSEIGATKALKYDPVPGPYKEMKLKEVGGVWL
ncbi:gluconate 2-dehydrogenase subunit 3 family protein [Colwellia echini]|uniref:Gluconate 2-dehydrogenase subunit 3 family protein n=1 Tax=Colwellia echini TaxID=1982103 RepID=A0ABY3N1E6_9GAMM|nr:gluconate 2-dehydrogenase subunit 3 family protein [Colwellia echini]TYK67244.1 gluconate 2-dehydrogenase subunit 3 family protein [Colwellia echini]